MRAVEEITPSAKEMAGPSYHLFRLERIPDDPMVGADIDPKTGNLYLGVEFMEPALRVPAREVCDAFDNIVTLHLGLGVHDRVGRDNVISSFLAPTARLLSTAERSAAIDRLLSRLTLIVRIFETESNRITTCRKLTTATEFSITTQELGSRTPPRTP